MIDEYLARGIYEQRKHLQKYKELEMSRRQDFYINPKPIVPIKEEELTPGNCSVFITGLNENAVVEALNNAGIPMIEVMEPLQESENWKTEILRLIEEFPNDQELGEAVRKLFRN